MKTAYRKMTVSIISFIALIFIVSVAFGMARKSERIQTAALSQQLPGQGQLNGSYGNVLNNLLAGGR